MARFLSRIRNDRGREITRLGHNHCLVEANGWKGGICVTMSRKDDDPDCDEFNILASQGSENTKGDYLIARLVVRPGGERTLTLYSQLHEIETVRI